MFFYEICFKRYPNIQNYHNYHLWSIEHFRHFSLEGGMFYFVRIILNTQSAMLFQCNFLLVKVVCRWLVNFASPAFSSQLNQPKRKHLSNFTTIGITVLQLIESSYFHWDYNAPGSVKVLTEISYFSHLLISVFYNSPLHCVSAGVFPP